MNKTITLCLMDPPYESANTTTALRIVDAAIRQHVNVNVFAYEGAVALTVKDQAPHANPVHGTSVEEEKHPTTKDFVASLARLADAMNVNFDWVNCGLCVDERGTGNVIESARRGGPPDFLEMVSTSDASLVVPTRRD
ncbi:MAG: DsrE family protein [Pseudomonadota bacterium]